MLILWISIKKKHQTYEKKIESWWKQSLKQFEILPKKKNLFELNNEFFRTISDQFSKLGILDLNKSRGAFAAYWDSLTADLKSVAASGWNAELIPEDENATIDREDTDNEIERLLTSQTNSPDRFSSSSVD